MSHIGRGALVVLLLLLGLCVWYSIAANYDYSALAGTYVFHRNGENCKLTLRADQTFSEQLGRSGSVQEVQGRWHRYGEAHVSFSKDFIAVSGEDLNESGEAHGQFSKSFGLVPSLMLAPLDNGPTFKKQWFR